MEHFVLIVQCMQNKNVVIVNDGYVSFAIQIGMKQEKKMRNEKYTCKVNCFWETKITFQMITFAYNKTYSSTKSTMLSQMF